MKRITTLLFPLTLCFAGFATAQQPTFEVTITNLTRGSTFTPILVASHMEGVKLFDLGKPASEQLEMLAEGGDTNPLLILISSFVKESKVTPPLAPGESVTVSVQTAGRFDYVSVASMLLPTNDGFFAVNGVEGPQGDESITVLSPAYDAGTEANDENCGSIPAGPTNICNGIGFAVGGGGEGYVHIHAGIHGIKDLDAAKYDWRNPVAQIVIRRVPQGESGE